MDIRKLAEFLDPKNSPELITVDDRGAPRYDKINPRGCIAAICHNSRGMLLIRIIGTGARSGVQTYRGEYYANISAIEMVTLLRRLSGGSVRITRDELYTGRQCTVIGFAPDASRIEVIPSSIQFEWPERPN